MSIHLYTDYPFHNKDIAQYCTFLQEISVSIVEHFHFSELLTSPEKIASFAQSLASIRILSIDKKDLNTHLFPVEIEYEKKCLLNSSKASQSLYDGFEFQLLLRTEWPALFLKKERLNIILTERKLLTFEEDNRYHLRSIILGYPCIISITGIIEAP